MKRSAIIDDDKELLERSMRSTPIRVESHEVRYLDLSGDGVPDAVEHITRSLTRSPGSERVVTVKETRRLEHGIGVNGKPTGVTERTTVSVLDPDEPSGTSGSHGRDDLARTA